MWFNENIVRATGLQEPRKTSEHLRVLGPKVKFRSGYLFNPYPTPFPYGNGMVLHFYQQQESSTTKTVHKVINKGLKAYVLSPHTGENFH